MLKKIQRKIYQVPTKYMEINMKVHPLPQDVGLWVFFLYKISPKQNKTQYTDIHDTHTHTHRVTFSVTIKKKNPSTNIKLCKPGPMRI